MCNAHPVKLSWAQIRPEHFALMLKSCFFFLKKKFVEVFILSYNQYIIMVMSPLLDCFYFLCYPTHGWTRSTFSQHKLFKPNIKKTPSVIRTYRRDFFFFFFARDAQEKKMLKKKNNNNVCRAHRSSILESALDRKGQNVIELTGLSIHLEELK